MLFRIHPYGKKLLNNLRQPNYLIDIAEIKSNYAFQPIELRAEPSQSHTKVIPLRNAGNIVLDVSLEVTVYQDYFTVIPAQLMIEPGGQSEVLLTLCPKHGAASKLERYWRS